MCLLAELAYTDSCGSRGSQLDVLTCSFDAVQHGQVAPNSHSLYRLSYSTLPYHLSTQNAPNLEDSGSEMPNYSSTPASKPEKQELEHETFSENNPGEALPSVLQMFGPEAPPMVWDTNCNYSRERVELYYLGNAGPALSHQQLVSAMQGKWPDEGYADKALTRWVALF